MSDQYHEPVMELGDQDRDFTRAINSLREELEAVDWYHQRAVTTKDPELRAIMEHNRDEEKEHAAMLMEWLRRRMPGWDEELSTYMFTQGDLTQVEEDAMGEGSGENSSAEGAQGAGSGKSLGLGSLK